MHEKHAGQASNICCHTMIFLGLVKFILVVSFATFKHFPESQNYPKPPVGAPWTNVKIVTSVEWSVWDTFVQLFELSLGQPGEGPQRQVLRLPHHGGRLFDVVDVERGAGHPLEGGPLLLVLVPGECPCGESAALDVARMITKISSPVQMLNLNQTKPNQFNPTQSNSSIQFNSIQFN